MKHIIVSKDGERISAVEIDENFADLHPPLGSTNAVVEAARCLYCYDAPCMNACPTHIDIPKFIHQIRTDNLSGSAKTILSANILGGTCARACPTEVLCEEVCVVNHTEGTPVKIGQLQRHAVDHLMAKAGPHPFARADQSGYRLAVVGAGPAGLSFAHRSSMLGHQVTVFEAQEKSGGLNEYGLAAYKMVDDFAQRELDFLLGVGGIEMKNGMSLGKNFTLEDLRQEFDAVFIGVGLSTGAPLQVSGEDLKGVHNALDFIHDIRCADHKSKVEVGNNVVVIGGGNTAIDAAVQAKCLGAKNVTLVYRRGREHMSATEWEQDLATTNGVTIRHWSAPVAFQGQGAVSSVNFARTAMKDGKFLVSDDIDTIVADMVLVAVGQKLYPGPNHEVLAGLEIDNGKIKVDSTYQTSLQWVYAGGDCVAMGEDLTVQAVEDGKQAAFHADQALRQTEKEISHG